MRKNKPKQNANENKFLKSCLVVLCLTLFVLTIATLVVGVHAIASNSSTIGGSYSYTTAFNILK